MDRFLPLTLVADSKPCTYRITPIRCESWVDVADGMTRTLYHAVFLPRTADDGVQVVDSVDLNGLIRLFVNHRPVFPVSKQVGQCFVFFAKLVVPKVSALDAVLAWRSRRSPEPV